MSRFALFLVLLVQSLLAASATAHEMRPAYLEMQETRADEFSILWKVPARGDLRLGLYVRLPKTCVPNAERLRSIEANAYTERWVTVCKGGLKGAAIGVDGLASTMTDALARIQYQDGSIEVSRLTPDAADFVVAGAQSTMEVAWTYFLLGVDHILSGLDHLLFVFVLILLIPNPWMLAKTITAFTVAHSITLAGASLGYFSLPQRPVEAVIALSIAFVARELIKQRPGERRLSESYPWLVAFAFGLLHGFGFAGALKETGLPQSDVPIALLTFNFGVEMGQLLFVTAVLACIWAVKKRVSVNATPAKLFAGFAIGTMSMVWLIERLSSFASGA
ncbi:HupE/UreJ family protein [Rhizobium leguminosarum]|jgi:hydrogenase/urease accessory protein HupE|uniref:HupE/UreJ family protein n=1 Tax=Rhizobium leguminosarum TaxID=384 RepID=UPI001030A49E|nr:HupE/UreJ family protein [Rhizobium leguminosarum]TAX28962.1 HupE/UreJ family protein [Rhizobium leguminosarum]